MALEPAGVSLQAEGFDKYIKDLVKIEKKQREVFDVKFKQTSLSFQQATKAAKDYEKQQKETAKAVVNLAIDSVADNPTVRPKINADLVNLSNSLGVLATPNNNASLATLKEVKSEIVPFDASTIDFDNSFPDCPKLAARLSSPVLCA